MEGVIRLLKEDGGCITISDDIGNKKMVKGTIGGFAIREATLQRKTGISIIELDQSWHGEKVLCLLLEPDTGETE